MSGFTGPYALAKWRKSKIEDGTTAKAEVEGEPASARFSYRVDLGNPGGGVSSRTATFKVKVPAAGTITFNYRFEIFHAWFQVEAIFTTFTRLRDHHQKQTFTFLNWGSTGRRTFQGTVSMEVEKGGEFGFEIGGSNFDSTSTIEGTLTITDFQAPLSAPPGE